MKNLVLLGSTGSIGVQTLKLASKLNYNVLALSCNANIELLEKQIELFKPQYVGIADENAAKLLKPRKFIEKIFIGDDAAAQLAALSQADIVLNAVVGIAGLNATLAALRMGTNVALANKESLVAGGRLVIDTAQKNGAKLIPVDSEHSAIFQCLQGRGERENLSKIWLTASGGPFFGKTKAELEAVTLQQALKHPNWSMGKKITIDSATLMNKGLEVIEAAFLFALTEQQISVVVHRQSIIHSMVQFCDGALLAQLGIPDMAVPIGYALSYPKRVPDIAAVPDILDMSLTFAPPDEETFGCLTAAKKALKLGGLAPCIVNGANEAAVSLFLQEKISFNDISRLVSLSLDSCEIKDDSYTIAQIFEADRMARKFVNENI